MNSYLLLILILVCFNGIAQNNKQEIFLTLDTSDGLEPINVKAETVLLDGKKGIKAVKSQPDIQDEPLKLPQISTSIMEPLNWN